MPAKKAEKTTGDSKDHARICELLSRIPMENVVAMASTSGLTRDEIRELCDAVRKLGE